MEEKKEKQSKGKFWIFEMYEDSRPNNWKEELEKTMIKICISPRHDKDMKDDGTGYKKPHYHVLICFEGPTTYNNVLKIANKVGANIVFQAYSVKGSWEYFIHKNNPEKAQYKIEDYTYLNGFHIEDFDSQLTSSQVEDIKKSIITVIREQKIYEYARLYDFLMDNEMQEMTQVLSNNTIFFVSYLRSKRFCVDYLNQM